MGPPETGVIIVDHGSRRAEANAMLDAVVQLYRERTGARIVEPAHMELAEPTLGQAYARCVAQGAGRVVVALFFLSPGRHSARDIPAIVAKAALEFPGVPYSITEPLGVDAGLVDLLETRVRQTSG